MKNPFKIELAPENERMLVFIIFIACSVTGYALTHLAGI
jgi:hypothetical protein